MKSLAELQAIKDRMKDRVVLRDGMEGKRVVNEKASNRTILETELQQTGQELYLVMDQAMPRNSVYMSNQNQLPVRSVFPLDPLLMQLHFLGRRGAIQQNTV